MSNLEDWQKRLLDERKELGERIKKGWAYYDSTRAKGGVDDPLHEQLIHMKSYYNTLSNRILLLIPDNLRNVKGVETNADQLDS